MEQLPLDVQLADYAVFDTWFAGSNGALVHALREAATVKTCTICWVWGPVGSGRTHLLQACVNEAHQQGNRTAYLSLNPDSGIEPDMAMAMDGLDVLCVDDIDQVAGDAAWEQALFNLYEGIRQRGARLIMAAEKSPLHCSFALPDLVSRFTSGATFRVNTLTDEEKISAMKLRAHWRGLDLPDDVAKYLFARIERSNVKLFEVLDRLDKKALVEKKRLTIPLAKSVLEAG